MSITPVMGVSSADDWCIRRETELFMELPAKIVRLETIDAQVFAILIDGRAIEISAWFANDRPKH